MIRRFPGKSAGRLPVAFPATRQDKLRETAMVYLGDLFNEIDYPVHVEKKFFFASRDFPPVM